MPIPMQVAERSRTPSQMLPPIYHSNKMVSKIIYFMVSDRTQNVVGWRARSHRPESRL